MHPPRRPPAQRVDRPVSPVTTVSRTRERLLGLPSACARALQGHPYLLSLLGGTLFLAIFCWAYDSLPYESYAVRDDGVITMSHAKNWVDYGFIGVNPSGPRVEGTSAPVEFFLYAALYRFFGIRYDTYANLQTLVASFLLGALFVRFFCDRPGVALSLTAFAAFLLTQLGSFFLWHGSGLENAVTHVFFLATIYLLYRCFETGQIRFAFAPVVFLATISRLESVVHIAPLLALFALAWLVTQRSAAGFAFGLLVLSLWSAFQLWRILYFGDFTPNTAYANFISVRDHLILLFHGDVAHLRRAQEFGAQIFHLHGGVLLAAAALPLALLTRPKRPVFTLATSAVLLVTACLHPFVFGETRLEPARSTTHLALFSVLSLALLLDLLLQKRRVLHSGLALLAATLSALLFAADDERRPRPICCDAAILEPTRWELLRIAKQHDLPRAAVAAPDLGVLSWHKDFNVVDLGRIGSPVIAKSYNSDILNDYFFDHIAPDIISLHAIWYPPYQSSLWEDRRFAERYESVRATPSILRFLRPDGSAPPVPQRFWIRRAIRRNAKSEERKLIDALRVEPSVGLLRGALERCRQPRGAGCHHVARTAYRFLPEFVQRRQGEELRDLFSDLPGRAVDLHLVDGFRRAATRDEAIHELGGRILERTLPHLSARHLLARSVFDLYAVQDKMIYYKEDCGLGDRLQRFFLRGVLQFAETARGTARETMRLESAPYRYFQFRDIGFHLGTRCLGIYSLGPAEKVLLQTGQLDWRDEIRWSETTSTRRSTRTPHRPLRSPPQTSTPDKKSSAE